MRNFKTKLNCIFRWWAHIRTDFTWLILCLPEYPLNEPFGKGAYEIAYVNFHVSLWCERLSFLSGKCETRQANNRSNGSMCAVLLLMFSPCSINFQCKFTVSSSGLANDMALYQAFAHHMAGASFAKDNERRDERVSVRASNRKTETQLDRPKYIHRK